MSQLRTKTRWLGRVLHAGLALIACACGTPDAEPQVVMDAKAAEPPAGSRPYKTWTDPLDWLPRGPEQTARVCARSGDDPVRDVFCGSEPASIGNLVELQAAFKLESKHIGGATALAITGHTTALSTRSVSAINPRVICLRLEVPPYAELLALSFVRGEQFNEIVVRDRGDKDLRFYVVGYRQECNDSERGCRPADLLTPRSESDWTEVTLYDETDLANTTFDCATCHQPEGPGTRKLLRMQELEPWTHWFFFGNEGGAELIADYMAAKGEETLAGMTQIQVRDTNPVGLQTLVNFAGARDQPNAFNSALVEAEVRDSAAANGGMPGPDPSPTWREYYERAKRGESIPVPYYGIRVTDPDKLAQMTEAYQAYQRGELADDDLPDLRDVYPDDERTLAEMGMMTEPGLDGEAVLLQACAQCHNPRLDQSLSRARFRADLEDLRPEVAEEAIRRLKLPADDPLAMPPGRLRVLSKAARKRAIEVLRGRASGS